MSPVSLGVPCAIPSPAKASRVGWVDIAKGWCIVMVVTMHSTLGVGEDLDATSWLHAFVAFAKPFRMPDFFLIAGLMAGGALTMPWRRFLDRKVLHFAYFYALWLAIVLVVKSGALGLTDPAQFVRAYLWSLVEPFSTLWFIQLLPLFYLALRLAERVGRTSALAVALALHGLAAAHPAGGAYAMTSAWTGWTTLDSFALFFIYFYVGHIARGALFRLAEAAARRPALSLSGLLAWGAAQALAVREGLTELPGIALIAGFSGALAVVAAASLLSRLRLARPLAYFGRNSLAIYLSFVLPMAAMRILLLKTGAFCDVGLIAVIVSGFAIVTPLGMRAAFARTPLAFLFTRPDWACLDQGPGGRNQAVASASIAR